MSSDLSITILPYDKNISKCVVIFIENIPLKNGKKQMAIKLMWNGVHSRIIPIEYEDEKELLFKIRVEIAKLKWVYWAYGKDLAQQILDQ